VDGNRKKPDAGGDVTGDGVQCCEAEIEALGNRWPRGLAVPPVELQSQSRASDRVGDDAAFREGVCANMNLIANFRGEVMNG